MSEVVSVAIEVNSANELFKFNKQEPLENIIKSLTAKYDIVYSENKFSFQFIRNQSDKKLKGKYVTNENRKHIVDGTELKLVFSPQELALMICNSLQPKGDICWALEKMAGQMDDPVFVSEIFSCCCPIVIVLVNDEKLPSRLYNYCLKAILGFLKFNFIDELNTDLITKLIKNIDSNTNVEKAIIENSLRLLELCVSKMQYSLIADVIDIDNLIRNMWDKDSPVIQECSLALINSIVYYCPCDDKKNQFFEVMNSSKFKSTISSNILYPGSKPSNEMAQQLYICQMLLFKLVSKLLDPVVIDSHMLPDAELVSENRRYSNFEGSTSDNTESTGSSTRNSKELSSQIDRISNSWKSEGFHSKRDTLVLSFLNLEISELNTELKCLEDMPFIKTVNLLTRNCIMYFSKIYRKNYQCSLFSEGCNNFITISYDVVNLIVYDILRIGESPTPESTVYYPLVFCASGKQPFVEELFCVAMWLFERTKREMRAETYDDYKKAIKVMRRQLTEGLAAQPKTFHELEFVLRGFTYTAISEQWTREMKTKEQHFLKKSTAVEELRVSLKDEMIEIIKNQRINYVSEGSKFPVWNSHRNKKEENKLWFARLSNNRKFILYSSNAEHGAEEMKNMKSLSLRDVEEFTIGKKCPHLKDVEWKNKKLGNPLGFSLITDINENKSLDFVAGSREVYDYWVDALNVLLGKKMKSNSFRTELNMLLDMELKIRLLDLDGIECPYDPPPIPPPPDNYDFNFT